MGNGVILGQTQIASTVPYDNTQTSSIITGDNVQEAIDQLFTSVSNGKSLVAGAITDKGISTSANATFQQMATNIGQIKTGINFNIESFSYRASSMGATYYTNSIYNLNASLNSEGILTLRSSGGNSTSQGSVNTNFSIEIKLSLN